MLWNGKFDTFQNVRMEAIGAAYGERKVSLLDAMGQYELESYAESSIAKWAYRVVSGSSKSLRS